jgi:hypothetical protein
VPWLITDYGLKYKAKIADNLGMRKVITSIKIKKCGFGLYKAAEL